MEIVAVADGAQISDGSEYASNQCPAAVATYDSVEENHVLSRVVGEGADEFAGRTFGDAGSIASMVVKNKLALPAAGDWRDRGGSYVFEARERFKGFESLHVWPLLVEDEVMNSGDSVEEPPGYVPGSPAASARQRAT